MLSMRCSSWAHCGKSACIQRILRVFPAHESRNLHFLGASLKPLRRTVQLGQEARHLVMRCLTMYGAHAHSLGKTSVSVQLDAWEMRPSTVPRCSLFCAANSRNSVVAASSIIQAEMQLNAHTSHGHFSGVCLQLQPLVSLCEYQ